MYELNPALARKADNTGSFITELGKYEGKITQAFVVTAQTGTRGVGMSFESGGQTANFTIYTYKSNGDPIMGLEQINALMTCLKLHGIKPVGGKIKQWDRDAKAEVFVEGEVFPELANKPIGIAFETEGYFGGNGNEYSRVVPKIFFQPGTGLTASEILDRKTQGAKLEKIVASLRHRPAKARTGATGGNAPASHAATFEDDLDIPF